MMFWITPFLFASIAAATTIHSNGETLQGGVLVGDDQKKVTRYAGITTTNYDGKARFEFSVPDGGNEHCVAMLKWPKETLDIYANTDNMCLLYENGQIIQVDRQYQCCKDHQPYEVPRTDQKSSVPGGDTVAEITAPTSEQSSPDGSTNTPVQEPSTGLQGDTYLEANANVDDYSRSQPPGSGTVGSYQDTEAEGYTEFTSTEPNTGDSSDAPSKFKYRRAFTESTVQEPSTDGYTEPASAGGSPGTTSAEPSPKEVEEAASNRPPSVKSPRTASAEPLDVTDYDEEGGEILISEGPNSQDDTPTTTTPEPESQPPVPQPRLEPAKEPTDNGEPQSAQSTDTPIPPPKLPAVPKQDGSQPSTGSSERKVRRRVQRRPRSLYVEA